MTAAGTYPPRFRDAAPARRDVLRRLHHLNPWWNLKIVAFAAIWAVSGYAALHAPLVVGLACYFVMGATIQGLVILMHEAVHGILFRNRRLNHWIGFLCGAPAFLSVTAYRVGHLPHHRHERGPLDPDELENFSRNPRVLALLLCLTFLAGELFGFYRVGPANALHGRPAERRVILVEYGLIVGGFVAAFALVPFHVMLHVWIFPALVARQLTNVRTLAEHSLTDPGQRVTATRTVPSNRFVSFFMCNLNYHIEHHLYPAVPWYNLRHVHRLLAHELRATGAQIYPSYTAFLRDLARWVVRALGPAGRTLPRRLPVAPPRLTSA
jgi:fatty acid desaturase